MRLPQERTSTFEAAGKQWRRAASAGLVSSANRAYMKTPVPRPTPNLWTHSRKNWNDREAILGLSRLDYPSAKAGGTVNGGAIFAPFILNVDWIGWLCYVIASKHFGDILPRISYTKYILLRFSYFGNCMELLHSLDISFHTFRTKYISSCRLWCEKAKNNSSVSKKL